MPTPPYIQRLREIWGQRPLLLPGVSGVVLDGSAGAESVLLVRRSDNGLWSLPAGIVEPGEQPADCLLRELWEEARIRARPDRLALLTADPEISYPNGDRCQFISMTFRCSYESGTATVGDEESTDVAWFPVDGLPADLNPLARRRISVALPAQGACVFDVGLDARPDQSR
jgi:8-oxo-dGTP pyrophosphatase MutT (NUDIX family)